MAFAFRNRMGYAAKAGTSTRWSFGNKDAELMHMGGMQATVELQQGSWFQEGESLGFP